MRAGDVTDTLELALMASSGDSAKVVHKPRLLSDNGSSYISSDLAEWLQDRGIVGGLSQERARLRALEGLRAEAKREGKRYYQPKHDAYLNWR
jgi:transposase InsO family protein